MNQFPEIGIQNPESKSKRASSMYKFETILYGVKYWQKNIPVNFYI